MPEPAEIHTRLIAHARDYDASGYHRGILGPYRDVLLLWRAKAMSYERMAAALRQHGVEVSASGVGKYCRTHFTKFELERVRREERGRLAPGPTAPQLGSLPPSPTTPLRGPKIARDNY